MSKEEIKQIISGNTYFKALDEKHLDFLVKNSNLIEYKAEDFIFSFRDEAKYFYLISKGLVTLQMFSHEKGSIALEEIKAGEILGWSWLNPPFTWRFDAYSNIDTELIVFDGEAIRTKMEKDTKFGYFIQKIFIHIIAERLQSTRLRLLEELGDNIFIPE